MTKLSVAVVIAAACLFTAVLSPGMAAAASDIAPSRPCGLSSNDWCPATPGDSCSKHKTAASCRADPACYGLPYQGESVVACKYDSRGFATNCPIVGCTSKPVQK